VHAKASTKCPYLTLENPHHQRQHCVFQHKVAPDRTAIKRFLLYPRHWRLRGEVLPALSNAISTASFKKTHSQCQRLTIGQMPKARYRRRNMCDGKLVAYILEENDDIRLHAYACGKSGGAYRDRTDDLMLAKQPLSQLS
jgi:hypothetical protein